MSSHWAPIGGASTVTTPVVLQRSLPSQRYQSLDGERIFNETQQLWRVSAMRQSSQYCSFIDVALRIHRENFGKITQWHALTTLYIELNTINYCSIAKSMWQFLNMLIYYSFMHLPKIKHNYFVQIIVLLQRELLICPGIYD